MKYKISAMFTELAKSTPLRRVSRIVTEEIDASNVEEAWNRMGEMYCFHEPKSTMLSVLDAFVKKGFSWERIDIPGASPSNLFEAMDSDNASRDKVLGLMAEKIKKQRKK